MLVCGELVYPAGTLQIPQKARRPSTRAIPSPSPARRRWTASRCSGSKAGGAVFVLCGASHTKLSNLNAHGNQGGDAGGITVGTQDVGFDSQNKNIVIHRNRCHRNSGIAGAGAISMNEASDNYVVEDNVMIGNFTATMAPASSTGATAAAPTSSGATGSCSTRTCTQALLNQAGDGGGMYIAGDVAGGTGAGNVIVDGNLIQGNMTGSGKGGGICVFAFNGQDVIAAPTDSNAWYQLQIVNNMIVNNVAAYNGRRHHDSRTLFGR